MEPTTEPRPATPAEKDEPRAAIIPDLIAWVPPSTYDIDITPEVTGYSARR